MSSPAPMSLPRRLVVGLMSGTSMDGVDAVLADLGGAGHFQVLAHHHRPYPERLREALLALNTRGRPDELHEAALAANAVAQAYADTTEGLLTTAGVAAGAVLALGAHGQTVRHRPGEFDGVGYTLQLLNGALLAERTGITVVCDFRSRDVAAGGQGAPLVPAFHAALFARPGHDRAVLNLGGIGNLTLLPAHGPVRGFDCGPGNALMDLWCQRHLGQAYDAGGAWAATGQVLPALLARLLDEPFLHRAPPKSTGRDLFHAPWLDQHLAQAAPQAAPQDVQATLAEFTARAAVDALHAHLPGAADLLVCGGGALNPVLMQRLASLCPGLQVQSTEHAGLPPMQVEAAAFAWLAAALLDRQPGNLPAVTGAAGLRLLGAVHWATWPGANAQASANG